LIYAKSKRFDLAASAFSKAIANNPQNAVAYNWQGMLYREANNYSRAEESYKYAIGANPNYGYAHLNLGILYDVYLKRPSDALTQYKEYQRLGGTDDLRVLVWVADLEKAQAAPTAPAAMPAAAPATSRPIVPIQPQAKEKNP
jgi:lipoprotein NlpI